jgi:hypothetical protein
MTCPHCGSEVKQDPWKLLASAHAAECESCGIRLRAVFNERSTFIALAAGTAECFAALLVANAAGYQRISEAVASVAGVLAVAICGYRYGVCLKVAA